MDVNWIQLPVFLLSAIVFGEGKQETEAVRASGNADHYPFIVFNKPVGSEGGTEGALKTVHLQSPGRFSTRE